MSDWIGYEEMRAKCIDVVDVRGQEIDHVRAIKEADGGVWVRILSTVNGGNKAVLTTDADSMKCVEFEAFIPDARVIYSQSFHIHADLPPKWLAELRKQAKL